jgi:hypothetical protein
MAVRAFHLVIEDGDMEACPAGAQAAALEDPDLLGPTRGRPAAAGLPRSLTS